MKKQTGEILLLVSVLVILAGVAIWQIRQIGGVKVPPSATPATSTPASTLPTTGSTAPSGANTVAASPAAPTPAAATSTSPNAIDWVDNVNVARLPAQVKQGRNPFKGRMVASAAPLVNPNKNGKGGLGSKIAPPLGPSGLPPIPKEIKLLRTLEWITPPELAQAFAGSKLEGVKLMARKGSNQVLIVGLGLENFQKAVALANAVDIPPPAPNFQLKGIVSAADGRFVALSVDGKFYTLKEGGIVPNVGWVVTRITPNRVTLMKDKQSVQLLLAGGHV